MSRPAAALVVFGAGSCGLLNRYFIEPCAQVGLSDIQAAPQTKTLRAAPLGAQVVERAERKIEKERDFAERQRWAGDQVAQAPSADGVIRNFIAGVLHVGS